MSALPRQVQEQADEAERIEQELYAANEEVAPPQDPVAEQPPEVEPPPDEVEQPVAQEAPQAQEAPKPQPSDEDTWQKRYLTLQGMFNAEVPRLNGRIKELESQLQGAIEQFKAQRQAPEAVKPERLVTEKDEEAFGSDLLDVVKRQAKEIIQAERAQFQQVIEQLRAENEKLHHQMGSVSERQGVTDRRAYLQALEREVPAFGQINTDQRFLAWLDETDPMTGLSRKAYLDDAFQMLDVQRTAAIFNSWPGAKPVQSPKPSPKAELAKQVAPSASRTASNPTANPNERVWSMQDIDAFYRDMSRGTYRGKDAEAQRIEAEIDLAVSQGRVKP
jgi:hypothetical protein